MDSLWQIAQFWFASAYLIAQQQDLKFTKKHTNTSTNALGLFTLNVGKGTIVTGTFSSINWGQNFKFLKVELDTIASGSNYIDLGIQQMMSVPYALYSSSSGSMSTNINSIPGFESIVQLSGVSPANGWTAVGIVPPEKKWKINYSYNVVPAVDVQAIGDWWANSGDTLLPFIMNHIFHVLSNNIPNPGFEVITRIIDQRDLVPLTGLTLCVPNWEILEISCILYNVKVNINGITTPLFSGGAGSIPYQFELPTKRVLLKDGACVSISPNSYDCFLYLNITNN
ncbi:MAG: hypothetical protein IPN88_16325 [Bacteroidetes bacterium]|nr:hypothetical protein [Bacteroidota bacterium]